MKSILPLGHPAPDATLWVDTLMGRRRSMVPPLVEYLVDDVVQRPIVTGLLGRQWATWGPDHEAQAAYLDNFIEFWLRLGYDIVRFEVGLPFAEAELVVECRKIYFDDLEPRQFLADWIEPNYPKKDYHRMYFGEILAISGVAKYRAKG